MKYLPRRSAWLSRMGKVKTRDRFPSQRVIAQGIRERGFELVLFEDYVAFRYAYQSRFCSRWDQGEETSLVVVLRFGTGDLDALPYDLLHSGRRFSFSLGYIFPHLSYPAVAALDRADLDALYKTQRRYTPGPLGDNATKEFVLRHVFEIAPHRKALLRLRRRPD